MTGHGSGAARLDKSTRLPLYQQIFVILRNRIEAGSLAPGERVSGEAELCEEFGVSRITARRALNELAEQGFVVRERGRGTRVVPHARPQALTASFDGLLENVGRIGRATSVEVRDFGYVNAPAEVAEALELSTGEPVQRAVRVRRLNDDPMSYLVTYVPAHIGRRIEDADMSQTPLLILLEQAGVAVASARQRISASLADAEVAAALDVPAGAPLLDVRRIVYDRSERPVELIRVLYRPEFYQFEMSMRRVGAARGRRWSVTSDQPSADATGARSSAMR
jgi:GntR family transcriptional regulator